MEATAVDGAPEVGVKLEVVDAPLLAQGTEHLLEVSLHLGVGAIQHVPGGTAPAAVGNPLGGQRQPVLPLHEPVGVTLKHLGTGLGDKGGHPERGLAAGAFDLGSQGGHPLLELSRRGEPVAHLGLITVVKLHVAQGRETLGTHLQVFANVGGAHVRVVVIPGAPAAGALADLADQRAMFGLDPLCQFGQQRLPIFSFKAEQRLALPELAGWERTPLAVHQDLQPAIGVEPKLPAKALAAGKGEQQPALVMLHQQQVVHRVIALIVGDAIDAGIGAAADRLRRLPAAHGLGQHLEAFAVDGARRQEAEFAVKQRPVPDPGLAAAGVVEPHPAQGAFPLAGLQQRRGEMVVVRQLTQAGQERCHGDSLWFEKGSI